MQVEGDLGQDHDLRVEEGFREIVTVAGQMASAGRSSGVLAIDGSLAVAVGGLVLAEAVMVTAVPSSAE